MAANDRHVIWNCCQIFYTKWPRRDGYVCISVRGCVCVRIRCRKLVSDRDVYHRWALVSSAEDGEVYTLPPSGDGGRKDWLKNCQDDERGGLKQKISASPKELQNGLSSAARLRTWLTGFIQVLTAFHRALVSTHLNKNEMIFYLSASVLRWPTCMSWITGEYWASLTIYHHTQRRVKYKLWTFCVKTKHFFCSILLLTTAHC